MKTLDSRAALAAAAGLALAGVMSLPAGAATGGHVVARAATGSQAFSTAIPSSKIKGEGKTAVFKPSALTVSEDTSGGNCGETNPPTSLTIKNTGTATAFVTFDGSPEFSLPKGEVESICLYGGSKGATATLGLTNKKDTKSYSGELALTASD